MGRKIHGYTVKEFNKGLRRLRSVSRRLHRITKVIW